MSDVRGVIFDKDGTLFDFRRTWEAWASAFLLRLASGDRDEATRMGTVIGYDLKAQSFSSDSVVIAGTPLDVAQELSAFFPSRSLSDVIVMINEEAELAPQQEAVPLTPFLTALRRRGLKLGVATNDAEAPARAHLGQAGVTDLFDFIAGSDSGHGGKPAPGQLQAFATELALPVETCIMVGDSTHDLHAGRAAGMRTVGVLTGLATTEVLAPLADVILPDVGHLPGWLDAH